MPQYLDDQSKKFLAKRDGPKADGPKASSPTILLSAHAIEAIIANNAQGVYGLYWSSPASRCQAVHDSSHNPCVLQGGHDGWHVQMSSLRTLNSFFSSHVPYILYGVVTGWFGNGSEFVETNTLRLAVRRMPP